ncbi:RDD family protein [Actinotalea sp. AC32]|nr:RDD family protein [Actinotalea sp. AC32]
MSQWQPLDDDAAPPAPPGPPGPPAPPASYVARPAPGPTVHGTPAYVPPADGAPAYAPAPYGAPAYGPTAYGTPAYGPTADGTPPYGAPAGYGYQPAPQWPLQLPPGFGLVGGVPAPLAPWIKRVGANLLDGLLAGAPVLVGYVVLLIAMTTTIDPVTGEPSDAGAIVGVLTWFACAAVSFGLSWWNRWVRQGRTGQSWGKSVAGIRLVGERTGVPIGAGMAFVRDLAHVADGSLYVGYLWPLWDARRQTFADKICSTVVVDG